MNYEFKMPFFILLAVKKFNMVKIINGISPVQNYLHSYEIENIHSKFGKLSRRIDIVVLFSNKGIIR